MTLRELCISDAEKYQLELDAKQAAADAEFNKKAIDRLRDVLSMDDYQIDVPYNGEIVPEKTDIGYIFRVEDLMFRVRRSEGYVMLVLLLKHCNVCGSDYERSVGCRVNIGQEILKEHDKWECESVRESKTKKELPPVERLAELIREIARDQGDFRV